MGGDTTTGRHTNDEVNRAINRSWAAFRELASDNGSHLFLTQDYHTPDSGDMTAGAVAGAQFGSIALPSDCAHLYAVDLVVSATDIRRLQPASFTQRNEFFTRYGAITGAPVGFFLYNIGNTIASGFSGQTTEVGTIGLVPAPDKSYGYSLWYLPNWTDLTGDANPFDDGGLGGHDWVIWDCVARFAAADNDMAATYAIAAQERQKAEARMLHSLENVQRGGPSRRIDVAGMNRNERRRALWGR